LVPKSTPSVNMMAASKINEGVEEEGLRDAGAL
jgi:hypothetical protein